MGNKLGEQLLWPWDSFQVMVGRVGQDVRSTENLADSLSWEDKAEGPRKPRCLECAGQSTGDMKVVESIRRGSPHPQVLS